MPRRKPQNWMPPRVVEEDADFVKALIEKLEKLIDSGY